MIKVVNGKTNDGEKRWLVGGACRECFADISADPDFGGWITVEILSSHAGAYAAMLTSRIKAAWRCLRGQQAWAHLEFITRKDALEFIDTFAEALDHAFHDGPPPPPANVPIKRGIG